MEEKLKELFPDTIVSFKDYKSFINMPERIQISSQEDINDYDPNTLTSYYQFRVQLPRPAINVKTLQLARASIPNVVASFPDTECTFWYYALPYVTATGKTGQIFANNAGVPGALQFVFDESGNIYDPTGTTLQNGEVYYDGNDDEITNSITAGVRIGATTYTYSMTDAIDGNPVEVYDGPTLTYFIQYVCSAAFRPIALPKSNYLRYVRLLPSYVPFELLDSDMDDNFYAYNRIFEDSNDLLDELELACNNDLLYGTAVNLQYGQFKFVKDLLYFVYDTRFKKFAMVNLDNGNLFRIMPVPADDITWMNAAPILAARDRANNAGNFFGVQSAIQPYVLFRNLNLRLGFNWATFPFPGSSDYNNMIRPHPNVPGVASGILTDVDENDLVAPGYADLVNTSCVHLYSDITGGSTVDSVANKALLASIPLNVPTLNVGFHSLPLNNPLTKISNQINEISIEMRNDSGQPFYLGNNAIVSLEFILTY